MLSCILVDTQKPTSGPGLGGWCNASYSHMWNWRMLRIMASRVTSCCVSWGLGCSSGVHKRTSQRSSSTGACSTNYQPRYVECTLRICLAMEDDCNICFLPTRRSNVPCHIEIDTEVVSQAFISKKAFNKWVWSRVLKTESISRKLQNCRVIFHHKMNTDGVAVSMLFSRSSPHPERICAQVREESQSLL